MPAVSIVDTVIQEAINQDASDVHLESRPDGLLVRFRNDGLLFDYTLLPIEASLKVLARIKVLAQLDVAEKRLPQDGKFVYKHSNNEFDLRVSTFPALHGEKIVIRILKRSFQHKTVSLLGFDTVFEQKLLELIGKAHGFILVTGPTGSGKTTTLYGLLQELCSPEKNVVTLEDPIEYTIGCTTQSQIQPEIGFTFARGIRSLLRQDPDCIMVGEIRDRETAEVAIQAALTGHLVLSSLHTTDAVGALVRLLDMAIPAFLINAAVTGVVAQRLVRVLCVYCRYEVKIGSHEQSIVEHYGLTFSHAYRAKGCEHCHYRGYKGRIVIGELLIMSTQIRSLLTAQPSYDAIYAQAVETKSLLTFRADASQKIDQGISSISEIVRVLC